MDGDGVSVRWLDVERVAADDWVRLERLLSAAERQRAGRFRFDHDRQAYIAGHALVRAMLTERGGLAPGDWRFVAGPHGKPDLAMLGPTRFKTNLSHTRGLAAAAVAIDCEVGIDVEWLARGNLTMDLVRRFFAPAEIECLAATAPERRTEAMFAVWTLKEAVIKAVGLGLSLPLESFSVTLAPLGIEFAPGAERGGGHWLLRRFDPGPAHVMALAVRHADAPPPVSARPADLDLLLRLADGVRPG